MEPADHGREAAAQRRAPAAAERDGPAGLRATIELAPIGIAQFGVDGRFLLVNRRLCEMLDFPRAELLTRRFQEITFPDDLPTFDALNARIAADEISSYQRDGRFVRRDGSVLWARVTASAVRDEGGDVAFFVSVAEDITEQRRIEESLEAQTRRVQENEARLRALVEASPLGIDIMDLDGNPIFYNPKAEELHGIPFEQAGGRGWAQAVHPDDRERVARSWYEAASAGRTWAATYRFLHPDGRVVWVSGRAAPMRIEGEMVGFVGTLEDITQLKEAQFERERLLAREREARSEAERATRRRDEVLAVVAHDLRNPVHTIAASASLMMEAPLPEGERQRQLEIIQRAARSMDNLIRDLVDIAQLESGSFKIHPARVDMRAVVSATLELFEQRARDAGITLHAEVEPDLPDVVGDADRLGHLLSNLVGNALKFTPEGGTVDIRVHAADGRLRITVADTGSGIAAEDLPHIFDRFWQSGAQKRAGAGLGLAICKAIAEAHGGSIDVESTPGRGSAFHVTLPLFPEG